MTDGKMTECLSQGTRGNLGDDENVLYLDVGGITKVSVLVKTYQTLRLK